MIFSAQVIENKTRNFGAELACKRFEALPNVVWVPQIVSRLQLES
jgi:hypothetical protein